ARRVVAAVFEPPQTLDEDWNDVAPRGGADDAAHGSAPLLRLPAGNRYLPAARQRELPRRRVLGDGRARADVGAARHAHRRDERGIGTDKALVLDHRAVLLDAVVIAGDGARADVGPGADLGVADVAQMIGLRVRAEPARLHLDEVAD